MKFLVLKSNDPYFNLAVEEYLFLNENDDVFMLWQNAPTVVVGKNQNAYAEIKMDVIREKEIMIGDTVTVQKAGDIIRGAVCAHQETRN